MATACFRPLETEEEEISYVFTAWQNTRMNKKAQLETAGGNGLESTNVDDLSVPLEHMSANSLNFWLCKFICEQWQSKPGNATLLRRCTYLFAALIAIWEMYRGKWCLIYWRKVIGGKTTFFEAIFHHILCLFVCSVLTSILFVF